MTKGDRIKLIKNMGVLLTLERFAMLLMLLQKELLVLNLGTVNILDACLTMRLKSILNW